MASYTVTKAKHATLSTTTVDTVTITDPAGTFEVLNRGTNDIYFTYGTNPSAPTAAGDNTIVVPGGMAITVDIASTDTDLVVKIIGNGDDYSVQAH